MLNLVSDLSFVYLANAKFSKIELSQDLLFIITIHRYLFEPVSQITLDVDNLQTNVVLYDLETAGFQREHDILQVSHEYIADIYSNVGTLFVELIM